MAKEAPHFVGLDSLRGLAALSVVFYHVYWPNPTSGLGYVHNCYLMVDLFFVISGFVICYAYRDKLETSEQLRRYAWLRFWRLYPVHLAFLLVFAGIEVIKYYAQQRYGLLIETPAFAINGPLAFLTNLVLLHTFNLHDTVTFNYPSWSISAEFYTYFVFAAVVLLAGRGARMIATAVLISAAALGALFWLGADLEAMTFHFGALRCLAGYFLGAALYPAYESLSRWEIVRRHRDRIGGAAVAAMALLVAGLMVKPRGVWDLSIYPAAGAVILLVALSASEGLARFLRLKPIVWLGTVSYSLYMVHGAVLWFFETALRAVIRIAHVPVAADSRAILAVPPMIGALALMLAVAVILLLAHLSYTKIERPFRDWSRRAWKRREPMPSTLVSLEGARDG